MLATPAKRFGKVSITTGDDAVPASMNVILEADQLMHLGSVRPTRNGSDDFDWEVYALDSLHWVGKGRYC